VQSAELAGQVALVTGGGRGIGADIARELAAAGMSVAVSARSREQVDDVARETGGTGIVADVSKEDDVKRLVDDVGAIDLLVANAGIDARDDAAWEVESSRWWHVFEVNVLGVYLCCRVVVPGMLERGRGRIVITASGAAYLAGSTNSAYASSKAAVYRFGETLANQLQGRIPVFPISPGLVQTEMTRGFPDAAPWTPPECAPRLVRALASGRFDRLSGRYLHAEHDPPEELEQRLERILAEDLNAIRLRRD
jgi:NAD(P)-dependent dehydrogenase (short-subunit alcohol dehydrogenase family)